MAVLSGTHTLTRKIMKTVKTIFTTSGKWATMLGSQFIAYAEAFGRARAAAELSRAGYHKEAKKLLLED
jgi:hypothetical protein